MIENPASDIDAEVQRTTTDFGLAFDISNATIVRPDKSYQPFNNNCLVLLFIDCPGMKLKKLLQ